MVEAMGEEGWKDFRNFSYEAYINLRRHSQFILSLFGKCDYWKKLQGRKGMPSLKTILYGFDNPLMIIFIRAHAGCWNS
jgi:hypothetical protein